MLNKVVLNTINRTSKLFQPVDVVPRGSITKTVFPSKSFKLMVDMGIIKQTNTGMYALLPLGLRVVEKLTNLVDEEMIKIGAQKMLLPSLTDANLWKMSDRYVKSDPELFKTIDKHGKLYILSPTYEEAITELISNLSPISPSLLPLKLYQISSKWRDEVNPRLGLLRGREFIMKDLYTFDLNLENAQNTYNLICEVYDNLFKRIGVKYLKAIGSSGLIGGTMSHEYHYLSKIGEDNVLLCESCGYSINAKLYDKTACPQCENTLSQHNAAEVGHTFLLDTKYSATLKATYFNRDKQTPLSMGCFGLGLTRIIATAVEILSTTEEIRWPTDLAPFSVCIMPPKEGSKEASALHYVEEIYSTLQQLNFDTIIDDRTQFTIGKRMLNARRTGYPYIIVVGKISVGPNPLFEVHDVNNSSQLNMSIGDVYNYFSRMTNEQEVTRAASNV